MPLFALANAGDRVDGDVPRAGASPRRSRSASSSATSSASHSGSSASPWLATRLERRPAPAAGRLGGGRRRRHDRGHRVHRLAARRHARLRGHASSRTRRSASSARRSCASALTWLLFRATALLPRRLRLRGAARPAPSRSPTSPSPSTPSATTSAARGCAGHDGRVRRLRVPLLRPGRAGDPRAAPRLRRRPLRLAAPAAERRPPAAPSSPPRRPRPPPSRARSGRCTTCCSTTRTRCGPATCSATRSELGLDVERFTDDLRQPRRRRAHRGGRRQRRPQRRLRHADVLRQRPPPLRRLRHRDPDDRGQGGARASDFGLREDPAVARRRRSSERDHQRRQGRSHASSEGTPPTRREVPGTGVSNFRAEDILSI